MYYPPGDMYLIYDETLPKNDNNHFLTPHNSFTVSGTTVPNASVAVSSSNGRHTEFSASAASDEHGSFRISLRLSASPESFDITVRSLGGGVLRQSFTVETDHTPPVIRFLSEIPTHTAKPLLTVSGAAENAVKLYLNGDNIPLKDSQFSTEILLTPGENQIRFEAYDLVGNLALIEKKVIFDGDPPTFVSGNISPARFRGGETASVSVIAEDAGSLAKTAPYSVRIGSYRHSGILVLSGQKNLYTGSFRVPDPVKGKALLTSVTLSDHLGNRKTYSFEEE
jgi:hypothetical protein